MIGFGQQLTAFIPGSDTICDDGSIADVKVSICRIFCTFVVLKL
tara:strand:- start:257 stop:388 length:132 start_codon:yes stop_codon:yes gene_type:complete